jgi:hypothetical protein
LILISLRRKRRRRRRRKRRRRRRRRGEEDEQSFGASLLSRLSNSRTAIRFQITGVVLHSRITGITFTDLDRCSC